MRYRSYFGHCNAESLGRLDQIRMPRDGRKAEESRSALGYLSLGRREALRTHSQHQMDHVGIHHRLDADRGLETK